MVTLDFDKFISGRGIWKIYWRRNTRPKSMKAGKKFTQDISDMKTTETFTHSAQTRKDAFSRN